MMLSIIIAYYKNIDALSLIFSSLMKQSFTSFEIIVAEDDNCSSTVSHIEEFRGKLKQPIKHVSQQDIGFRKNKILNEAIRVASGEIIVFIDGDCIPHKHFLKEHSKHSAQNAIYYGRRVMIGKELTERLLNTKQLSELTFLNLIKSKSKRIEEGVYLPFRFFNRTAIRGIWGCNWSILKANLLKVNGFDEDYVKAGVGEDVDIEWRLLKNGCKLVPIKHKAIVYHLHHNENYTTNDVNHNFAILKEKIESGLAVCLNGLHKKEQS